MKIKGLFLIGFCTVFLLLVSCQGATQLSSSGVKDGEELVSLIDNRDENSLDEMRGVLPRRRATSTSGHHRPRKTVTPMPSPTPVATSTPIPTPMPSDTPTAVPTEPTASPVPLVTVSDIQIYPSGPEIARIEFVAMAQFSSPVNTAVSLMGFYVHQGQETPGESTCGQIPESSQASPVWNPPSLVYGPGEHSYVDWGYLPAETVPVDATHFVITLAIKAQPGDVPAYCTQQVLALGNEGIPALPPVDAAAIKVGDIAFWPDTAVVDRNGSFDFGARLDFESIIMNQVRLLVFFIYQGQDIPGEATCMSQQMPEQSGEVFWSTGASTRFWTGMSHFEQAYTYQAAAPDDATHLVMWLMLDDSYGRPVLCWQKVIELSP